MPAVGISGALLMIMGFDTDSLKGTTQVLQVGIKGIGAIIVIGFFVLYCTIIVLGR